MGTGQCVKWSWGAIVHVPWGHHINQECLLLDTMSDRKNKLLFWQQGMVFSVLWPKGQQVGVIILLDTMVHHLVSKALPAQEFPNYRLRLGSQRAGPVQSLLYSCSSQVLLHVTGTLQAQSLQRCEFKIWKLPRRLVHSITKSISHAHRVS